MDQGLLENFSVSQSWRLIHLFNQWYMPDSLRGLLNYLLRNFLDHLLRSLLNDLLRNLLHNLLRNLLHSLGIMLHNLMSYVMLDLLWSMLNYLLRNWLNQWLSLKPRLSNQLRTLSLQWYLILVL